MLFSIGYYGSGGGGGGSGGDYGGNGYSSYERNRPYGPPQAVDISSNANHGYYDSYENQNGLDWQQDGYGGILNDKLNVIFERNSRQLTFRAKYLNLFLVSVFSICRNRISFRLRVLHCWELQLRWL